MNLVMSHKNLQRLIPALICCSACFAQKPLLEITSPPEGMVVERGQTVYVKVAADPSVSNVYVMSDLVFFADATPGSLEFKFTVPKNAPVGRHGITAVAPAKDHRDDLIQSKPIQVLVEIPLAVAELQSTWGTLPLHMNVPGPSLPTGAQARFTDGTWADVSASSRITYTSDNPSVVTVSPEGWLTPVAPGTATITAKYSGVTTTTAVVVDPAPPPPPPGSIPQKPPIKPALLSH